MGRFLCNYFTAHPNPEGPTHTHRPTHLPNSAGDTALGLAATKSNDISACLCGLFAVAMNIHELMNIPEVFLELISLRPRHHEYSRHSQ